MSAAVEAGSTAWRSYVAEREERRAHWRELDAAAAIRQGRACPLLHIGAQGTQEQKRDKSEERRERRKREREGRRRRALSARVPGWRLQTCGRVVELKSEGLYRRSHCARRGEIRAWSRASRRNMLKNLAAAQLEELARLLFVTLTYPAQGPADGRVAKGHLKALRRRWERKWGPVVGAWKMEFQRRGVVHWHLAIQAPPERELWELRAWIALAWYEVVSSGDGKHLEAGTQCDWARRDGRDVAAYFCAYGRKAAKEYQNTAPPALEGLGRWWGLWGRRIEWERQALTVGEANVCRRVLVRYRQAQVREQKRPYRVRPRRGALWVIGQAAESIAAQLRRYMRLREEGAQNNGTSEQAEAGERWEWEGPPFGQRWERGRRRGVARGERRAQHP